MTTYAAPSTDTDWTAELAHLIYRTRIEADITQAELAHALRVDQATVTAWENGSGHPDVEALAGVARACGQHLRITIGTG